MCSVLAAAALRWNHSCFISRYLVPGGFGGGGEVGGRDIRLGKAMIVVMRSFVWDPSNYHDANRATLRSCILQCLSFIFPPRPFSPLFRPLFSFLFFSCFYFPPCYFPFKSLFIFLSLYVSPFLFFAISVLFLLCFVVFPFVFGLLLRMQRSQHSRSCNARHISS